MGYVADIELIRKNYKFNESNSKGKKDLKHNTGNSIHILPYVVNCDANEKRFISNFKAVIGEFSRRISAKALMKDSNNDVILNKIVEIIKCQAGKQTVLKNIIKELFFDNEGELQVFHPIVFNYTEVDNISNKKLGQLLFDVLYIKDSDVLIFIKNIYNTEPNNILLKAVKQALPELVDVNDKYQSKYKNCVPLISELFTYDFQFMLKNSKFFIENFEMFLKYYYFFYVSQLSLKLNSFFEADLTRPEKVYFNLDWETTSKTRTSYEFGWSNLLEPRVKNIFSHANCLELLNHNNMINTFTYVDFKKYVDTTNEDEKMNLSLEVESIFELYKEYTEEVHWENFKYTPQYENDAFNSIRKLFNAIDFQFNQSGRKGKYENYCSWFIEFCKFNFLKKRGQLGYTLNLTQDYLIFLTQLCIGNQEKIRLKVLFSEYEKRGISFDRDSQLKIIQLFEKLNLIEKKSDSGDAQYVKSIL